MIEEDIKVITLSDWVVNADSVSFRSPSHAVAFVTVSCKKCDEVAGMTDAGENCEVHLWVLGHDVGAVCPWLVMQITARVAPEGL